MRSVDVDGDTHKASYLQEKVTLQISRTEVDNDNHPHFIGLTAACIHKAALAPPAGSIYIVSQHLNESLFPSLISSFFIHDECFSSSVG